MTKIKHAYKAGTSFIGYVWNTLLCRLYTILYFIFRVIYIPLTIIHKLSFIIGFVIPFIFGAVFLKEFYPQHYTVMMCVKAHADAGIINSSFIGKYVLYGIISGIALFILLYLFIHVFSKIGQYLNDKVLHTQETINMYSNHAKNYSRGIFSKKLSDAQIMDQFKKSDNYVPPHKMFGFKETATTYYKPIHSTI